MDDRTVVEASDRRTSPKIMKSGATSRAERVAVERADALFEQRRIDDIHAIEKATVQQMDEKKTKLRQLVGASYKDVICSADAILEMSGKANAIQRRLRTIQQTLKRPTEIGKREDVKREADDGLLVMGSRVKYVMDAQEMIWSALDAGDYVEAARRLLRTEVVYEQLMQGAKNALMKRFPFVEHQWPGITQLKPQILESVRQHLIGSREMEEVDVRMCLTAIVTLTPVSSMEVLQTYLQCRKLSILNVSTDISVQTDASSETLCQIGVLLQDTLLHVVHLFSTTHVELSLTAIQEEVRDDRIGFSGLLFGNLGDIDEQRLWEEVLESKQTSVEQIAESSIVSTVQDWLLEVARIVQESGEGLLLNCSELKTLSNIESTVRETVRSVDWETQIRERLGIDLNLWKTVFESVIQEKCLSIVETSFKHACEELQSKLEVLRLHLSRTEVEPLGKISAFAWELHSQRFVGTTHSSFRSDALQLVTDFDTQLGQIMQEVSSVLGTKETLPRDGEHSPTASVRHGSVRSFSLLSGTLHRGNLPRRTERSVTLEPKIQSLWENTAFSLAQNLEQQISNLPRDEDVYSVESALLVGTVAMGLAENCPCIGILAGPVEEWHPEAIPRSTRSSVKADPGSSPHLSNAFRNAAFRGIQIWADWALNALVASWTERIRSGNLTGDEHLQEITMSHQASESPEDQQMKFSVPAAVSEPTMQLLMDASSELQRLGLYSSLPQILHLFQFNLEDKIRTSLRQRIQFGSVGALSDNFVLQLLLDFRFLCDICSAGEPVSKLDIASGDLHRSLSAVPEDAASLHDSSQRKDPAVKRAVLESQKLSRELEIELSNILDPIDWATSEPHLWAAEQRCYRRTQVLFGTVGTTTQNLHASVPVKLPTGAETNCLRAAPVTVRFQYLPVRPTTNSEKGSRSSLLLNYTSLLEPEDDPSGTYSFSEFGKGQTKERMKMDSSMQETDVGSFTSLGTMFTDKAAEMSALAQQRIEQFGDYLQPSSLASSSIFSFAKRVKPTSDSNPS